jgi:hypothetical protein
LAKTWADFQINDGLNSVARMRRGAIEDFYLQAVISFMVSFKHQA